MVFSWAIDSSDCVVLLHELLVDLFLVVPKLWKFTEDQLLGCLEDSLYCARKFTDSWQLWTYLKVSYSTELAARYFMFWGMQQFHFLLPEVQQEKVNKTCPVVLYVLYVRIKANAYL